MLKGAAIHCRDTAWRRAIDGHPGLLVRVSSPSLLQLAGVLDLATRDLLEAVLGELHSSEVHLDVADLEFADAAGLGVLAVADAQRRSSGRGCVLLHRAGPTLRRTVCAAGLNRLLPEHQQDEGPANWPERAACHAAPIAMFFEESDPVPAQQLCWSCPVSGNCLSYALQTSQAFGIWGGLTSGERALLLGKHAADTARSDL